MKKILHLQKNRIHLVAFSIIMLFVFVIRMNVYGEQDSDMFTFTLDGSTYTLPIKATQVIDDGWVFRPELSMGDSQYSIDAEMSGLSMADMKMARNSQSVYIKVANFSENVSTLKESYIVEVRISDENSGFEIADKINFDSTLEDIVEVYGLPENYDNIESIDLSEDPNLTWKNDDVYLGFGNTIGEKKLSVKFEDSKIDYFNMLDLEAPEDVENAESVSSDENSSERVPETARTNVENNSESETVAVTEFEPGDDIFSRKVKLNGVVYTLPIPVSSMIQNGFSFKTESKVPGRRSDSSEIHYDGADASAPKDPGIMPYVYNENSEAAPVEECKLYEVSDYLGNLVLPGDISLNSSFEDLCKVYPKLAEMQPGDEDVSVGKTISMSETSYNTTIITFRSAKYSVRIWVDDDSQMVNRIECDLDN